MFKTELLVVYEMYGEMATNVSQDELTRSDVDKMACLRCPVSTNKIVGTEY
jgi:hypothetical protein